MTLERLNVVLANYGFLFLGWESALRVPTFQDYELKSETVFGILTNHD